MALDRPPEGSERGSGDQAGDQLDLTARCENCGEALGPGRSDRKFCGARCLYLDYRKAVEVARIEANSGRICLACGGPIPPEKRADARFCCSQCRKSTKNPAKRLPRPHLCPVCGASFHPFKYRQVLFTRVSRAWLLGGGAVSLPPHTAHRRAVRCCLVVRDEPLPIRSSSFKCFRNKLGDQIH